MMILLPLSVPVPIIAGTGVYKYTGREIEPDARYLNSDLINIEGDLSATEVGEYEIRCWLKDSDGCVWSPSDAPEVVVLSWSIIEPLIPECTAPTGLIATYGDTLKDVSLSGGLGNGQWVWKEPDTTLVGYVGTRTHKAEFRPWDSSIYNRVEADVTIEVSPSSSTLQKAQEETYKLLAGQGVDLNTLIILNPEEYIGDVTFTLDDIYEGILLSGETLIASIDTEETSVNITAKFAGANEDNSGEKEYTAADDLEFTVEILPKTIVTLGGLTYADKTYDETAVTPTGTLTFEVDDVAVTELTEADVDVTYKGRGETTYAETNIAPVNVGKYTVTYTIKETVEEYKGTVSYDYEIAKAQITLPTLNGENFTYTGGDCGVRIINEPATDLVDIYDDAGIYAFDGYVIRFVIKDTANYEWTNGTIEDITLTYNIKPAASEIIRNSNSNKFTRSSNMDLNTLVELNPAEYADEVKFIIETLPAGVILENSMLKTAADAEIGIVTVKARFNGVDVDTDITPDLEYSPSELTFDVIIARKSSSRTTTKKYDITTIANKGGTVEATPSSVEKGEDSELEIKVSEGYEIDDVIIDGESVGAVGEYTIKNINQDVNVKVVFKKVEENSEKQDTIIEDFKDVNSDDWYYDAVKSVTENKLMNGTSGITFDPNVTTTRAMIVTILYRLEKEPEVAEKNIFSDVENNMWYSNAITWASEKGIVLGMGDGKFAPNEKITREQLVTILYRYANYKKLDTSIGENTNILSYDDALKISEYAVPAMQWACGESLINGVGNNLLDPKGNATRAQIATIMMRFMESIN